MYDPIDFDCRNSGQDEEELSRLMMKVPGFLCSRGHSFMNDA